jgi:hypothetical protein
MPFSVVTHLMTMLSRKSKRVVSMCEQDWEAMKGQRLTSSMATGSLIRRWRARKQPRCPTPT